MPRCPERSPINDWQCNRKAHDDGHHLARDPKAAWPSMSGCIITGQGMAVAEKWETR